jgi:hypothetical protein
MVRRTSRSVALPTAALLAVSLVAASLSLLGCTSLTEPSAITVTKEKEEAAPAKPQGGAQPGAAQAGGPQAGGAQPGATQPAAAQPKPVQPPQGMPAPAGGACGG